MNGDMKGTGKKDDPWLVEDAYDFYKLKGVNRGGQSNLSYAKLVKNIDFNNHDELKYGWLKSVHYMDSNMLVLDGNGKEVRNIVFKDRIWSSDGSITGIEKVPGIEFSSVSNVKWVNIVCMNCQGEHTWLKTSKTSNCSFSIILLSPVDSIHSIPLNMTDCTISLTANLSKLAIESPNNIISRCHFILDVDMDRGTTTGHNHVFKNCNFDSCYFTGKLYFRDLSSAYYRYILSNSTISSCYFAIDSTVDIANRQWQLGEKSTISSCSFVDTDLITTVGDSSKPTKVGNFYCLTTEQAKNKEYLQSIGFPVA